MDFSSLSLVDAIREKQAQIARLQAELAEAQALLAGRRPKRGTGPLRPGSIASRVLAVVRESPESVTLQELAAKIGPGRVDYAASWLTRHGYIQRVGVGVYAANRRPEA